MPMSPGPAVPETVRGRRVMWSVLVPLLQGQPRCRPMPSNVCGPEAVSDPVSADVRAELARRPGRAGGLREQPIDVGSGKGRCRRDLRQSRRRGGLAVCGAWQVGAMDDDRAGIRLEVAGVEPGDDVERRCRLGVLSWIDSGAALCRTRKPAT